MLELHGTYDGRQNLTAQNTTPFQDRYIDPRKSKKLNACIILDRKNHSWWSCRWSSVSHHRMYKGTRHRHPNPPSSSSPTASRSSAIYSVFGEHPDIVSRNHLVLRVRREAGPSSSSESVSSDAFVSLASNDPSNGPMGTPIQTCISTNIRHFLTTSFYRQRRKFQNKNKTHVLHPHLSFLYTPPTDSESDLVSKSRRKDLDLRILASMILRDYTGRMPQCLMIWRMRREAGVGELSVRSHQSSEMHVH